MGRKSNAAIKKEKEAVISGIVQAVIALVLLACGLLKEGIVGEYSHNFLSYVFGNFYPVLLVTLIITGLFRAIKKNLRPAAEVGIAVINVSAIVISGVIDKNPAESFSALRDFAKTFTTVFNGEINSYGSGLLGKGLYLLFSTLVDRTITSVASVICLLLGILLLIPKTRFERIFKAMKEGNAERRKSHEEAKKRRLAEAERRRIERAQLEEERKRKEKEEEEERKLKLAMEMNSSYEEEPIEAEVIVKPEVKEPVKMKSNSKYFIDLDDNEVKAAQEEKPSMVDIKPNGEEKVASLDTTRSRKVSYKSGMYHYPPNNIFESKTGTKQSNANRAAANEKGKKILEILNEFDIKADLVNTHIGPSVTKFEIKPDSRIKINKILNIQDNIKMELAAKDIRIEAPIPGRSAVGIEIPNEETIPVRMGDMIQGINRNDCNTSFCLGKDLMGQNVYCDLSKMPHLLIAGATGSGKSVCINSIITSILMRSNPNDVKLVLVDPKKVEFTPYHDIPHLLWPVITDAKMAAQMLQTLVKVMEDRYEKFSEAGVRNIQGYNSYVSKHNGELAEGEKPLEKEPYIIIIIDELADLMMIARNEVETSIQRITQLARASGIHLVVATQRPSTDVITGLIKSNIPSRISFAVSSSIDSRTILDCIGAERLLGNGDMLYAPQGETSPIRLQGVYVTDAEIAKVTDFVKGQAKPNYDDTYYKLQNIGAGGADGSVTNTSETDPLYDEIVEFVKTSQKASTSLLQRRFGIGFNRAARVIDTMEEKGIVGPANGSKPREVLIKPDEE